MSAIEFILKVEIYIQGTLCSVLPHDLLNNQIAIMEGIKCFI